MQQSVKYHVINHESRYGFEPEPTVEVTIPGADHVRTDWELRWVAAAIENALPLHVRWTVHREVYSTGDRGRVYLRTQDDAREVARAMDMLRRIASREEDITPLVS